MKRCLLYIGFALITAVFFYKQFLYQKVPFPGDLLIANYAPWKEYSYLGYNPGSFPNKAQYFDVLRQIYPWKTFSLQEIKRGTFPLWNPYNFSGSPLFANFQSAVLYPLNIVYFFMPRLASWSLLVFLEPFLAGVFTMLFAGKIGIGKIGTLMAGISFAFSSFMSVWLEYNTIDQVILWLPLSLLAAENLIEKKSPLWSILFIFSLVSSLFAGHIQIFFYCLVFLISYIAFRVIIGGKSFDLVKRDGLFFLFLTASALGIGAIQLIPGVELIAYSARSSHQYSEIIHQILVQPWELVMLFVPDFFGNPATGNFFLKDTYVLHIMYLGLVPLFFAFFTLWKKKNAAVKFFWFSSLIALLMLSFNPLSRVFYSLNLPFISSSSTGLGIFIIIFSLSIIAGFGVDFWLREKKSFKACLIMVFPLLVIFALIWGASVFIFKFNLFDLKRHDLTILHNLVYSSLIFIFASSLIFMPLFRKKNNILYASLMLLILLETLDLFHFFRKFNPFVTPSLAFPNAPILAVIHKRAGINRVWGYGYARIEANFATKYSIFSPDGYDPLYPRWYGEFIQSSVNGRINTVFTDQTRSDAIIKPGFGKEDLPKNKFRLKVFNLLGVKYILDRSENGSTAKTFPPKDFSLIYNRDGWRIFENKSALPRVFLASDYKVFKTNAEFDKLFFAKDFNPLKTILLEKKPKQKPGNLAMRQSSKSPGLVNVLKYSPNQIIVNANAANNSLLFLSDTYYPGWQAFVDGKKTKIYKADYAFRSIFIPKGKHLIVFKYAPLSFKLGLDLSIASLIIFLIYLSAKRFRI
ncbi:YfhO family protein [Patescibacteria group bacterium]|nr:YfhO family protein [Patescibacteria group bacterium]